jgi:hypothetical protein
MPGPPNQSPTAKSRRPRALAACILAVCAVTPACDSPPGAAKSRLTRQAADSPLAGARIDLAKNRLAGNAPDEALALLVSALAADPSSAEARVMAGEILGKTRWHLPEIVLEHRLPIDRLEFAPPSSLWVCLAGASNTTVRWNLETAAIESVLFPIPAPETRSLVIDPTHRSMVLERAGIALLCNAETLKPVRDLGAIPDFVTPSATIVFSSEGLLLAHPVFVSETDRSLVWHLRDAASGQIIRSTEPAAPDRPRPLAAFLDRRKLRVLHADGSLLEMPVSPVEPIRMSPPEEPHTLLHAQFSENGGSAVTLKIPSPHRSPEPFVLSFGEGADPSLEPAALLERFPWNRHPGLASGLLSDPQRAPLEVDDRSAFLLNGRQAPLHTLSAITAVAVSGDRIIVGEKNGTLTLHRTLPLPLEKPDAAKPSPSDEKSLAALRSLTIALAGRSCDDAARTFTRSDTDRRLQAFKSCDFAVLQRVFPELDFSPLVTAFESFQPKTAAPEAMLPLTDRLARSTPASPPSALETTFETDDTAAIVSAIEASGNKGPAAAKALELALASTHPEWIQASLAQAADLPPLLRRIAVSRIAWLQGRKADALAPWPDVFPDLKQVRLREDWDGWEQADFGPALDKLRLCVGEELAAIDVPESPTPDQRKAIAARLDDPATMKSVGRGRFAKACLKAALVFAAFKDETETTFRLASRARELGEAPAPCLRAEAIALTALGDYQKAHDRWIALITEHPVDSQQPGDYAEAAYTAFENANPQQAMAILTTGLHRFPNDGNFALRAGWVALLTGNAERAYRFLLTGRQIGYPPEKLENATALLAIAAQQTGAAEDADAFYQDLILLDPAWEDPQTLESLEWPEELKSSLRQLVW